MFRFQKNLDVEEVAVEENLSIEELNELIEEIKKDEEEYAKVVAERKLRRNNSIESFPLRKLIYFLSFYITVRAISSAFGVTNPFRNNKLILAEAKKKEIISELEDKFDTEIPLENEDNYILLSTVFSNDNLTDKEKNNMFGLIPLLADNSNINKEEFYKTLKNLDIEYTDRPDFMSDTVVGVYFFPLHSINIYVDEKNSNSGEILNHEIIHSMYTNISNFAMPHFLCEGMTELLENEYFSETPFLEVNNYIYEVNFVKLLCELVGEDSVLEAYTTGNMEKIYNYLDNIYGTKGDAKSIILRIDEIFNKYFDSDFSFAKEELKELIKKLENYFIKTDEEKLIGISDGYSNYDERIGKNAFYYYENILLTATYENRYFVYRDFLDNVGILQKAYFSKELKNSLDNEKVLLKSSTKVG